MTVQFSYFGLRVQWTDGSPTAAANSTKPDLNRQLRSLASIWQLFRLDQEKIDSHFFSAMMKILWNWKMNLFAKTLSLSEIKKSRTQTPHPFSPIVYLHIHLSCYIVPNCFIVCIEFF